LGTGRNQGNGGKDPSVTARDGLGDEWTGWQPDSRWLLDVFPDFPHRPSINSIANGIAVGNAVSDGKINPD